MTPSDLKIQIFADGANLGDMLRLYADPRIRGFTTNPTLMRKAGVADYRAFALDVVEAIPDRPISFEVFADDFDEMFRQALEFSAWGSNVFVKIPVMNTRRQSSAELVRKLSRRGVQVNVTAMMTLPQVHEMIEALRGGAPAYLSIFAGRIADSGRDPLPLVAEALEAMHAVPGVEMIWASPREVLNVVQADRLGCHVITMTNDLLKKLDLLGKDLDDFSLETVRMFYEDAQAAGYGLRGGRGLRRRVA
jgi:transaldolase